MSADECPKCGEEFGEAGGWDGGVCINCWSGYDPCKACNDYRCEHLVPYADDLKDPGYRSCHCGHDGCRAGFVEG